MKFLAAMALLFGCVTFTAHAQPHPETGIEYWAIQATPETNSAVAFGSINTVEVMLINMDTRSKPGSSWTSNTCCVAA